MSIRILHRDNLLLGGFAGLKEHRLVADKKIGGKSDTWDGLGNFVYLADARFVPNGETTLHPHKEIDVISVMVEGRIAHEGSLEHGKAMEANQAQVQRAGGKGFEHNEVNPDATENRMIQLWVLPETKGEPAGYKFYDLKQDQMTRIYGGNKDQNDTFESETVMEVGLLSGGQNVSRQGEFMAYITRGTGILNGQEVADGDLARGENLSFKSTDDVQIIVVTTQ
ncbi:MAG: pirin family protein [Robiginitomaculum sp.]|nr:pirin family protein [Robiginitomaculum sp.]